MPNWNTELPDNPTYPYMPTRDPSGCPHEGTWRVIYCDDVTDTIRCDRCGARAKVACSFDDDFA